MIDTQIKSAIIAAVEELEPSLVQLLVDTVQIPSMNPSLPGADIAEYKGAETKVATYLKSVMDEMDLETDLFAKAEGRHNIVGISRGRGGGKSLIFNGHIDVAALGPMADWTIAQPWSGEIIDGKVYGRGTADKNRDYQQEQYLSDKDLFHFAPPLVVIVTLRHADSIFCSTYALQNFPRQPDGDDRKYHCENQHQYLDNQKRRR